MVESGHIKMFPPKLSRKSILAIVLMIINFSALTVKSSVLNRFDRFTNHHANYYDRNGDILPFGEAEYIPIPEKKIEMPKKLGLMIELAEKLASQLLFLRVDFYEVNGKVYFGELTFYPASGMGRFVPESWDIELGKWLKLPIE